MWKKSQNTEQPKIFRLLEVKCGKYQKIEPNKKQQYFRTLVGEMWKTPKNLKKAKTIVQDFWYVPLLSQKSPKILGVVFWCIFHTSPPRVPQYRFLLFVFLFFCTFHFSSQESNFSYFPHLLCRFSGSKSPEHFVLACILLLSVSDFPKDS